MNKLRFENITWLIVIVIALIGIVQSGTLPTHTYLTEYYSITLPSNYEITEKSLRFSRAIYITEFKKDRKNYFTISEYSTSPPGARWKSESLGAMEIDGINFNITMVADGLCPGPNHTDCLTKDSVIFIRNDDETIFISINNLSKITLLYQKILQSINFT